MKIHFIIEIEDDSRHCRATVERVEKVSKAVKIAEVAPPPIPPEPELESKKICRSNSGPQFDPGFLAVIRDCHEPFTRRALAVATGLSVTDVTQRLIRLHKKGWIEQPARELWRKTKTFGIKL
jgi:hypothetical protein